MKKILLIDDNFHSEKKGAPLFSMEREFLKNSGYNVYTISFNFNNLRTDIDEEKDFFVKIKNNFFLNKVAKFFGSKEIEYQIKTIIDEIKPDIIHNHLISKYPISVFKALPTDIPIIQTLHGPNFFCPTSWGNLKKDSSFCSLGISSKCMTSGCIPFWQYPLQYNLFSEIPELLKKITLFHCPSKNIQKVAHSFGFSNTEIVPLGLRKNFTNIKLFKRKQSNKILFIGSLHPVKGLDYLLLAMQNIIIKNPQVQLLIAGKGSYETKYKEKVLELKIEKNVQFLGFVDSTKIIDLFQSVDLTVVPSIWSEQFGMIGPESLACGTPVVGSDIGGIPEWLKDKENGLLVKPRDINGLETKISFLLGNPELLHRYGKNGYEFINKYHTYEGYRKNLLRMIENARKNTN